MYSTRTESLANNRILKVALDLRSTPISFAEVLRRWQTDADFRSFFLALLADAPFSAFRWETPPLTTNSAQRPFEFVLLDSPDLARKPDPTPFAGQLRKAPVTDTVVSFPNLGKDALLVVPRPCAAPSAYGHLAAFVRQAPDEQKHALWALVGKVMQQQLGTAPLWLSTAGAGVSWLHVRLDKKPKYYGYGPYRDCIALE